LPKKRVGKPARSGDLPAEPSPPSKLRFKFGLDEYEDEDCPGPLGKVSFARAARHVLYQFAGGPHDDKVPEHKYFEVGGPNGYLDLESRTGCVDLHLALTYDCMGGGEDAEVFLVMPDLTEEWAPCYKSVDIVTAVPRERDIDGVARYCLKKVARELLGAVIEPTVKPRFYYVKTATGG